MSCLLLSILERHNLPPIYSLPAHLFTFHSSLDMAQPAKVSLTHLQELKKQLKQELVVPDVWGQVWGALHTLQLPRAWEGAVLDYAGAQHREALLGRVRLCGIVQEQEELCGMGRALSYRWVWWREGGQTPSCRQPRAGTPQCQSRWRCPLENVTVSLLSL